MTEESAYPVSGPFSQHRIAVFATRDEDERAIVLQEREREVGDGSRVSRGDERYCFWVKSHDISLKGVKTCLESEKKGVGGEAVFFEVEVRRTALWRETDSTMERTRWAARHEAD